VYERISRAPFNCSNDCKNLEESATALLASGRIHAIMEALSQRRSTISLFLEVAMLNPRRAFTLIELLVVIAIIAILAAILFPVFAQAKSAAKKTASISNNKQLTLGALQYYNDFDDLFPIAAYNETFSANPASPDSIPMVMIYPYVKNMGVMMDPMDPATVDQRQYPDSSVPNPASVPWSSAQAFYNFCLTSDWGINAQYFDPVFLDANFNLHMEAINDTAIVKPAETYMALSSLWGRTASGAPYGGGNAGVDPPCVFEAGYKDTRPDASNYPYYYWYGGWNPDQTLAWNQFGGVWPWHTGGRMVVVSFADGHAKSLQLTQITTGCNVLDGFGGFITNEATYDWSTTF